MAIMEELDYENDFRLAEHVSARHRRRAASPVAVRSPVAEGCPLTLLHARQLPTQGPWLA